MFPVTGRFHTVSAGNSNPLIRVELWTHGDLITDEAEIISGTVSDEYVTGPRRSLSLSIPQTRAWLKRLELPALEARPYRGVTYGKSAISTEWCALGRFPIRQRPRSLRPAELSLTATDRWSKVERKNFPGKRGWAGGALIRSVIADLIQEVGLSCVMSATSTELATATVWDKSRSETIAEYCEAINAMAWMDRNGVAQVVDRVAGSSVLTLRGVSTLLADVDMSQVFNAVAASSSANGVDFPPRTAYITNRDDPASPRRMDGTHLMRYSSPLLLTPTQALQAATDLLAKYSAPARQLKITMLPDASLDAGDVITVEWDGGPDVAQIQSITHPLTPGPLASITTVSTRPE